MTNWDYAKGRGDTQNGCKFSSCLITIGILVYLILMAWLLTSLTLD